MGQCAAGQRRVELPLSPTDAVPLGLAVASEEHLLHRTERNAAATPRPGRLHEVVALAQLVAPGRVRKPADAVSLTGGCEALAVARRERRRLLEPALSSGGRQHQI